MTTEDRATLTRGLRVFRLIRVWLIAALVAFFIFHDRGWPEGTLAFPLMLAAFYCSQLIQDIKAGEAP